MLSRFASIRMIEYGHMVLVSTNCKAEKDLPNIGWFVWSSSEVANIQGCTSIAPIHPMLWASDVIPLLKKDVFRLKVISKQTLDVYM
ncbi:unnamed protein product [Victoria cruziana]